MKVTSSSPSTLSEPPTELNAVPVIPNPWTRFRTPLGNPGHASAIWSESAWPHHRDEEERSGDPGQHFLEGLIELGAWIAYTMSCAPRHVAIGPNQHCTVRPNSVKLGPVAVFIDQITVPADRVSADGQAPATSQLLHGATPGIASRAGEEGEFGVEEVDRRYPSPAPSEPCVRGPTARTSGRDVRPRLAQTPFP